MLYCAGQVKFHLGQVKFKENNMLKIGILVPGQVDSTENCRALKYILHLIYSGIPCPKNGSIGYTCGNYLNKSYMSYGTCIYFCHGHFVNWKMLNLAFEFMKEFVSFCLHVMQTHHLYCKKDPMVRVWIVQSHFLAFTNYWMLLSVAENL